MDKPGSVAVNMDQTELCKWLREHSSGIYRPSSLAAEEIEYLAAESDRHKERAVASAREARDAQATQAGLEAQLAEASSTLAELVRLEDLRKTIGAHNTQAEDEFEERHPRAWQRARNFLSSNPAPSPSSSPYPSSAGTAARAESTRRAPRRASSEDPYAKEWGALAAASVTIASSPSCTEAERRALCNAIDRLADALMGAA